MSTGVAAWAFLGVVRALSWEERRIGNVIRSEDGQLRPITREDAIRRMKCSAKKTRRRYVKGLLYDPKGPGCNPLEFQHVIRRPSKQGMDGAPRLGRRVYALLESSVVPNVYDSFVAVAYPTGQAPHTTNQARAACGMLPLVRVAQLQPSHRNLCV